MKIADAILIGFKNIEDNWPDRNNLIVAKTALLEYVIQMDKYGFLNYQDLLQFGNIKIL